jgi:phenylalanyl-tRNA synthetase beta chain
VAGLLGMDVPGREVMQILQRLGFDVEPSGDGWSVTVPSWRVDVHRKEDLIEEVGRHYGFEHLPVTFPAVEQAPPPSDPRIARDARVRRALLGMGFSEAITFAFIEAAAASSFSDSAEPVALANPLSEKFAVMRPSLLPGLVDSVSHNRRHGRRDVRLFEIGTRFSPSGETRAAAVAWTGLATPDDWSGHRRTVGFFDVKGVAEQLGSLSGVALSFDAEAPGYLVDGRRATIRVDGTAVGVLGELSPAVAAARDLPSGDAVYVAEVNLDALGAAASTATRLATTLPRFPAVVRDLAILVNDTLSAEKVRGTIRSAAPDTLAHLAEFDRYQGKGIPDGKVSLAFRLTFQSPDRTLTDDEVQAGMQRIVGALERTWNAVQR